METFIIKTKVSHNGHMPFSDEIISCISRGDGIVVEKVKLLIKLSIHKMWYVAIVSTETSKWIAELRFKILSSFCSLPDFNLKLKPIP